MDTSDLIKVLIAIVFFVSLIGTIVTQVQDVNVTGWTFTGHAGAEAVLLLIPFTIIAAFVVGIVLDLLPKKGV